jgi:hypothetical protein
VRAYGGEAPEREGDEGGHEKRPAGIAGREALHNVRFQIAAVLGFAVSARLGGITSSPQTRVGGQGAKPRSSVDHCQGAEAVAAANSSGRNSTEVTRPPSVQWKTSSSMSAPARRARERGREFFSRAQT